jgi:hypothetical protein
MKVGSGVWSKFSAVSRGSSPGKAGVAAVAAGLGGGAVVLGGSGAITVAGGASGTAPALAPAAPSALRASRWITGAGIPGWRKAGCWSVGSSARSAVAQEASKASAAIAAMSRCNGPSPARFARTLSR